MVLSLLLSTFITVFIAELGDKTQLATLTISGTSNKPLAVFLGSSSALVFASLLGALTGGSIGQGLPLATGAAIASPDRPVICLHGDGGAMYTIQSLWTQARESLNVTNIIFSNRAYAILKVELDRVGALGTGDRASSMFSLDNPEINWVSLAESLGVPAKQTLTVEEFHKAFSDGIKSEGPSLIEIVI